jgi:hypothetical protein
MDYPGLRREKPVIIILSYDAVTSTGQGQKEKTARACAAAELLMLTRSAFGSNLVYIVT